MLRRLDRDARSDHARAVQGRTHADAFGGDAVSVASFPVVAGLSDELKEGTSVILLLLLLRHLLLGLALTFALIIVGLLVRLRGVAGLALHGLAHLLHPIGLSVVALAT